MNDPSSPSHRKTSHRSKVQPKHESSYYKSRYDTILAKNKSLNHRLRSLEHENKELKHSVYQLTAQLNAHLAKSKSPDEAVAIVAHSMSIRPPQSSLDEEMLLPPLQQQQQQQQAATEALATVSVNHSNNNNNNNGNSTSRPHDSSEHAATEHKYEHNNSNNTKAIDDDQWSSTTTATPPPPPPQPSTASPPTASPQPQPPQPQSSSAPTSTTNTNTNTTTAPSSSSLLTHMSRYRHPAGLLEDAEPSSAGDSKKNKKNKVFHRKYDFTGHSGSVYTVGFSPNGKLLASGSFDKSVRVWDLEGTNGSGDSVRVLAEHTLNVSDVCWSGDSAWLLSGSFDGTVKLWDMGAGGKCVDTFAVGGLVQSVRFEPNVCNMFYVGSACKQIKGFDRRMKASAACQVFENDAMVNSVYVADEEPFIISGDSKGMIKTWHTGTQRCLSAVYNESTHKPISHVTVSRPQNDETARFLGVNSYDNVLRVYDYDTSPIVQTERSEAVRWPLSQQFASHKNKNWPIKSDFYCGVDAHNVRPTDDVGADTTTDHVVVDDDTTLNPNASILLATGSADNNAYVYEVALSSSASSSLAAARGVVGPLVQRLEGHKDRVYAVNFHPTQPVLATCSADCTVKIWAPKTRALGFSI